MTQNSIDNSTSSLTITTATPNTVATYAAEGALSGIGPLTNGQIPIGSTNSAPVAANIISTDNSVAITNGPGSLDLSSSPRVAFSAYVESNLMGVTGDGTSYVIIANRKIFDVGNNYDATTGIFTVPSDGMYVFGASVGIYGLTPDMDFGSSKFVINTIADTCIFWGEDPATTSQGNNSLIASGTCCRNLTANETVRFVVQVAGGQKVVNLLGESPNDNTYWYGYKL